MPILSSFTILNFGHPLTSEQIADIEKLTGQRILNIINLSTQMDLEADIFPQVESLLDSVPQDFNFERDPYIVNLPGLSFIAASVLACLHGHSGYFPPILRILGKAPHHHHGPYSVFSIIELQTFRTQSRI
ncbi:MAG TPA: CRISPR-associated protein Csx15 [Anaerolineales bacterium]|nr:CRISPR-associated protein Csx15 [Anaerolineales bacterium]